MRAVRPIGAALMTILCNEATARSSVHVIVFEPGSSAISPSAARTLRVFADRLKRTNEKCPMRVTVTGHMDSFEAASDNKAIDVERAQATVRELQRTGRTS